MSTEYAASGYEHSDGNRAWQLCLWSCSSPVLELAALSSSPTPLSFSSHTGILVLFSSLLTNLSNLNTSLVLVFTHPQLL